MFSCRPWHKDLRFRRFFSVTLRGARDPADHIDTTGWPDLTSPAQPCPAMRVDLGIRGIGDENYAIKMFVHMSLEAPSRCLHRYLLF